MGNQQAIQEKENFDAFKHRVRKEIRRTFIAELDELKKNQTFEEKYHDQFFEEARIFFIHNTNEISEELQQKIAAVGGLEDYCNLYSKQKVNEVYDKLILDINSQANFSKELVNPQSVINVEELRKFNDKTLFQNDPFILNETNKNMNQKISDFKLEDELYSILVKAYAHHLANVYLVKQYYDRYTELLTESMQQDILQLLTNRVQVKVPTDQEIDNEGENEDQLLNTSQNDQQHQQEVDTTSEVLYNYYMEHPELRLQSLHSYLPVQKPITAQVVDYPFHQSIHQNTVYQPASVYQLMLIQ